MVQFPTQIQHVVVVIMENRTVVDNLFSAYYGLPYYPGGQQSGLTWDQVMSLHNPNSPPVLTSTLLEAKFDPDHSHQPGFKTDANGQWAEAMLGCDPLPCSPPPPRLLMSQRPKPRLTRNSYKRILPLTMLFNPMKAQSFVLHPVLHSPASQVVFQGLQLKCSLCGGGEPQVAPPTPTPTPIGYSEWPAGGDASTGGCDQANFQVRTLNMTGS